MLIRRSRFIALLATAGIGVAVAGCSGAAGESAGAREIDGFTTVPEAPATAEETTPTTPPTTAPPTTSPRSVPTSMSTTPTSMSTTATSAAPAVEECLSDRRTLEVVVEGFLASTGSYPGDQAEIVAEGLLRSEIASYDVQPGTGEVVRVAGAPCQSPVVEGPSTADEFYDMLTPGEIALLGGSDCARELAEINAAFEAFEHREGREPTSLDEMRDDLAVDPVLWELDFDAEQFRPAAGSICPDLTDLYAEEQASACRMAATTLEVARDAYLAMFGPRTPEPSQADLVDHGILRQEVEEYVLADGAVVSVADGPCA